MARLAAISMLLAVLGVAMGAPTSSEGGANSLEVDLLDSVEREATNLAKLAETANFKSPIRSPVSILLDIEQTSVDTLVSEAVSSLLTAVAAVVLSKVISETSQGPKTANISFRTQKAIKIALISLSRTTVLITGSVMSLNIATLIIGIVRLVKQLAELAVAINSAVAFKAEVKTAPRICDIGAQLVVGAGNLTALQEELDDIMKKTAEAGPLTGILASIGESKEAAMGMINKLRGRNITQAQNATMDTAHKLVSNMHPVANGNEAWLSFLDRTEMELILAADVEVGMTRSITSLTHISASWASEGSSDKWPQGVQVAVRNAADPEQKNAVHPKLGASLMSLKNALSLHPLADIEMKRQSSEQLCREVKSVSLHPEFPLGWSKAFATKSVVVGATEASFKQKWNKLSTQAFRGTLITIDPEFSLYGHTKDLLQGLQDGASFSTSEEGVEYCTSIYASHTTSPRNTGKRVAKALGLTDSADYISYAFTSLSDTAKGQDVRICTENYADAITIVCVAANIARSTPFMGKTGRFSIDRGRVFVAHKRAGNTAPLNTSKPLHEHMDGGAVYGYKGYLPISGVDVLGVLCSKGATELVTEVATTPDINSTDTEFARQMLTALDLEVQAMVEGTALPAELATSEKNRHLLRAKQWLEDQASMLEGLQEAMTSSGASAASGAISSNTNDCTSALLKAAQLPIEKVMEAKPWTFGAIEDAEEATYIVTINSTDFALLASGQDEEGEVEEEEEEEAPSTNVGGRLVNAAKGISKRLRALPGIRALRRSAPVAPMSDQEVEVLVKAEKYQKIQEAEWKSCNGELDDASRVLCVEKQLAETQARSGETISAEWARYERCGGSLPSVEEQKKLVPTTEVILATCMHSQFVANVASSMEEPAAAGAAGQGAGQVAAREETPDAADKTLDTADAIATAAGNVEKHCKGLPGWLFSTAKKAAPVAGDAATEGMASADSFREWMQQKLAESKQGSSGATVGTVMEKAESIFNFATSTAMEIV